MEKALQEPVEIFYSYAREDEELVRELKGHLRVLERQGAIVKWHDRDISAGSEWRREINQHLNKAQIILLFISSFFIDSDYCYDIEMKRALERSSAGEARVIPIILRPVDLRGTFIAELQRLPVDGKAITSWSDRHEGFKNAVMSIRVVIEEIQSAKKVEKGRAEEAKQVWESERKRRQTGELLSFPFDDEDESNNVDRLAPRLSNVIQPPRTPIPQKGPRRGYRFHPSQDHEGKKPDDKVIPDNISDVARAISPIPFTETVDDPFASMEDEKSSRLPYEQCGSVSMNHFDTDDHKIQDILDTSIDDDIEYKEDDAEVFLPASEHIPYEEDEEEEISGPSSNSLHIRPHNNRLQTQEDIAQRRTDKERDDELAPIDWEWEEDEEPPLFSWRRLPVTGVDPSRATAAGRGEEFAPKSVGDDEKLPLSSRQRGVPLARPVGGASVKLNSTSRSAAAGRDVLPGGGRKLNNTSRSAASRKEHELGWGGCIMYVIFYLGFFLCEFLPSTSSGQPGIWYYLLWFGPPFIAIVGYYIYRVNR